MFFCLNVKYGVECRIGSGCHKRKELVRIRHDSDEGYVRVLSVYVEYTFWFSVFTKRYWDLTWVKSIFLFWAFTKIVCCCLNHEQFFNFVFYVFNQEFYWRLLSIRIRSLLYTTWIVILKNKILVCMTTFCLNDPSIMVSWVIDFLYRIKYGGRYNCH